MADSFPLSHWINDFLGIIFPNVCEICGRPLAHGEDMLCLHCLSDLPLTGFAGSDFTEIHQRLAFPGLPVEKAASWCYYRKDSGFARLLQLAKYGNRPKIARKLGRRYAGSIEHTDFFNGIDIIVPVPISLIKRMNRGYNQSLEIARGISDITGIQINEALKVKHHPTQTLRNRYERWINSSSIYSICPDCDLSGRSVLLVDDVITSGATMVSCLRVLHSSYPDARLSVISLALTQS